MSVLIKGMSMPKNCAECGIRSYDAYSQEEYCPFTTVTVSNTGRQEACPLLALPEKHGDLIDKDKFFSALSEEDFEFSFHFDGAFVDVTKINYVLKNQRTVIEAEG